MFKMQKECVGNDSAVGEPTQRCLVILSAPQPISERLVGEFIDRRCLELAYFVDEIFNCCAQFRTVCPERIPKILQARKKILCCRTTEWARRPSTENGDNWLWTRILYLIHD